MTTAKEVISISWSSITFLPRRWRQVGDKGYLEASNGDIYYILNTKKENNLIIHYTQTLPSKLEGGFKAGSTRSSASALRVTTRQHLLHQALRSTGTMLNKKGPWCIRVCSV